MNYSQLKKYINFVLTSDGHHNVMVTGQPGSGKSQTIAEAVLAAGFELIISHPVIKDPTDYKGLPTKIQDKAVFLPFGELLQLIEADKPTVLFLDDVGQASKAVQAALMQIVHARAIDGHAISDNVKIIAASNRRTDNAGVAGVLQPFKSRFTIVNLDPDADQWIDWALGQQDIPIELIGAVKYNKAWINKYEPSKTFTNVPQPRNLHAIGKQMTDGLPRELLREVAVGRLGLSAGTDFMSFMALLDKLPTPADILANPKTADVPEEASCKYVLSNILIQQADADNLGAFATYLDRYPNEYITLFRTLISEKKPKLCNTTAFINMTIK